VLEGIELSWCALEQNSTYSRQLELFWLEVQSVFIRVHPWYAVADLRSGTRVGGCAAFICGQLFC
jgi:hypothetical protein